MAGAATLNLYGSPATLPTMSNEPPPLSETSIEPSASAR